MIKAVIILFNVGYIKKNIYNMTHNKEYPTSSIAVIRNTHLMSCICTFVAFLMVKVSIEGLFEEVEMFVEKLEEDGYEIYQEEEGFCLNRYSPYICRHIGIILDEDEDEDEDDDESYGDF